MDLIISQNTYDQLARMSGAIAELEQHVQETGKPLPVAAIEIALMERDGWVLDLDSGEWFTPKDVGESMVPIVGEVDSATGVIRWSS